MQCPVDGETLVMTDRSGVEIDYCPKCRGVWLDRGELDKIIDRAGSGEARPVVMAPPTPAPIAQNPVVPPQPAAHPSAAPDLHGQPPFDRRDSDRRDADYRPRDDDRYRDRDRDDRRRYRDDDDDDYRYRKGKKRDSFLSDLFDF